MEYIHLNNGETFEVGFIKQFEGELLQVKVNKVERYKVGTELSCRYNGNHFNTSILKKGTETIFLYVPLTQKQIGIEKRRNPRISVNIPALINSNMEENIYHVKPATKLSITDISLNGIGFTCTKRLMVSSHSYYIYLDLNNTRIKLEVKLKYVESLHNMYKFGCEISGFSSKHFRQWLKFILKSQILYSLEEPCKIEES